MKVQELTREFKYNSVKLADPSPAFTLQQVRDFYANIYPEIINADIEGPEQVGDKHVYTFRRAVGTKGGLLRDATERVSAHHEIQRKGKTMVKDLAALEKIGWFHAEPRAGKMIRITADYIAEKPDFVLADHHFQRIAQLHAIHCTRAQGAAA